MLKKCKDHLDCADESYFVHLSFAFCFAFRLFGIGLAAIVHALIPALCVTTASDNVIKLAEELKERRRKTDAAKKHD